MSGSRKEFLPTKSRINNLMTRFRIEITNSQTTIYIAEAENLDDALMLIQNRKCEEGDTSFNDPKIEIVKLAD